MWPEEIRYSEEYNFKSSPESHSDSTPSDTIDNISDDDFLLQLSSNLDFPLLLDQGEDESMKCLDSNDILTDFSLMDGDLDMKSDFDFLNDELLFSDFKNGYNRSISSSSSSSNPASNNKKNNDSINKESKEISYFDYLNNAIISNNLEIKAEEHSEESCSSNNSLEPSTPPSLVLPSKKTQIKFFPTNILPPKKEEIPTIQVVPQIALKLPVKRVPIKPKIPYTVNNNNNQNIVFIKKENISSTNNNLASKMVILDSVPVTGFNNNFSTTLNNNNNNNNNNTVTIPKSSLIFRNNKMLEAVDPRILKRQERKIKNRESASISRKKKKDYLNSLEDQVKNLTEENVRLLQENLILKARLAKFENSYLKSTSTLNITAKKVKPALFLCAFLFVIGLNINFTGNPLKFKSMMKMNSAEEKLPKLFYGRNLLWTSEETSPSENNTLFLNLTMCPALINETESARLLSELERWIGKPSVKSTKFEKQFPTNNNNNNNNNNQRLSRRKKIRVNSYLAEVKKRERNGPENNNLINNEIQVFRPKIDQIYSEFYEAINRRDDTFYVVSFSEQHMLLPALDHNNTQRPKMSLLIPSVFPNVTSTQTFIQLMQIDCEVLDTKLINVKYGSIPRPYRHYGNVTAKKGDDTKKSKVDNSTTFRKLNTNKRAYKPYFLSKNLRIKSDEYR